MNVLLKVAHFKESKSAAEKNAIVWEFKNIRQRLKARESDFFAWRDNLEPKILLREAESIVGDFGKATEPPEAVGPVLEETPPPTPVVPLPVDEAPPAPPLPKASRG